MDVELLYHTHDGESTASPFAQRIATISRDAPLHVTSPYLSLDVFRSITAEAESWRLLTDVQELVRTRPTKTREEISEFIRRNRDQVRDCRRLHAKTIITDTHALVGSANLTESGLGRNAELGVLFHETDHVSEFQNWFDQLWTESPPVDETTLRDYPEQLRQTEQPDEQPSMPATGPAIDASLDHLTRSSLPVDEAAHEELVSRVRAAPSRTWAASYLDWVEDLFALAGLDGADPRVALTMPASYPTRLPVNVNKRYVLTGFLADEQVGFMLPGDSTAVDSLSDYISDFGAFSTRTGDNPYWFEFPGRPEQYITDELKQDWKRAIDAELGRAERSKRRAKHEPVVYRAATDASYRDRVLNDAFE